MKTAILLICAFFLLASAEAQKAKKKTSTNKTVAKKTASKKPKNTAAFSSPNTTTFTSTSSHKAYNSSVSRLEISDPLIKALNAKANGADIKFGPSGLPGVPKGTYGFAKGRIVLYSTGATSQGTATGMGSVGTGTSPGVVGSSGPGMGVNGKSPYAGPDPYGTRLPLVINPLIDTTKRGK